MTMNKNSDREPPYPIPPNVYCHYEQTPSPHVGGAPFYLNHHHCEEPSTLQPIHHVSHESSFYRPHMPMIIHHHHHHYHHACKKEAEISYTDNKPTVRVYSKAEADYSLTIRDGKVILAPSNPSDPHQHWITDGSSLKDEEGYSSFALVNKATGQAIKHPIPATYPVQLVKYNPDKLDESVLWSRGRELGDCYTAVRRVDNIKLNLDAYKGVKEYGGVKDGTPIVLWEWNEGANQMWNIVPY